MTPDTGFEIRALAVRGRSTLSLGHGGSPQHCVLRVDGEEIFCFFQIAETGKRAPNSSVKGSGANHYPRAPAQLVHELFIKNSS